MSGDCLAANPRTSSLSEYYNLSRKNSVKHVALRIIFCPLLARVFYHPKSEWKEERLIHKVSGSAAVAAKLCRDLMVAKALFDDKISFLLELQLKLLVLHKIILD